MLKTNSFAEDNQDLTPGGVRNEPLVTTPSQVRNSDVRILPGKGTNSANMNHSRSKGDLFVNDL